MQSNSRIPNSDTTVNAKDVGIFLFFFFIRFLYFFANFASCKFFRSMGPGSEARALILLSSDKFRRQKDFMPCACVVPPVSRTVDLTRRQTGVTASAARCQRCFTTLGNDSERRSRLTTNAGGWLDHEWFYRSFAPMNGT